MTTFHIIVYIHVISVGERLILVLEIYEIHRDVGKKKCDTVTLKVVEIRRGLG